jgi:hypothetical protein
MRVRKRILVVQNIVRMHDNKHPRNAVMPQERPGRMANHAATRNARVLLGPCLAAVTGPQPASRRHNQRHRLHNRPLEVVWNAD